MIFIEDVFDELEEQEYFEVDEWDLLEANPELRENKLIQLWGDLEWAQRELDVDIHRATIEKELLDLMTVSGDSPESKKQRRNVSRCEKSVNRSRRARDNILREITRVHALPPP